MAAILHLSDHRKRRAAEYPSVGDQLDALWKGGEAAERMRQRIAEVKARFPKPTTNADEATMKKL